MQDYTTTATPFFNTIIEIADLRGARFAERLDPSPSLIARRMPLAEGEVERGFQHAQDSVGGGAALAYCVRIFEINFANILPIRGWRVRNRAGTAASAACHSRTIAAVNRSTS
jgi:hypothetical protein